jgi:hypothetical protein
VVNISAFQTQTLRIIHPRWENERPANDPGKVVNNSLLAVMYHPVAERE